MDESARWLLLPPLQPTKATTKKATGRMPRLADRAAADDAPVYPGILLVPAVHAEVLRLFADPRGEWYVASHRRLEAVSDTAGVLARRFAKCLVRYYARSLDSFTRELNASLCWFFGVYEERGTMIFLGTCRLLPHDALTWDDLHPVDMGFSLHGHLPPAVPILPRTLTPASRTRLSRERWQSLVPAAGGGGGGGGARHTDLYDGLLLINTQTLFAVRLCYPTMIFLTPLLKRRESMDEFLAMRVVQSHLYDTSPVNVDHDTQQWYRSMGMWAESFFGEHHGTLLDRIQWQVMHIGMWLTAWQSYIGTLDWEAWSELDIEIQRLYVLLPRPRPNAPYRGRPGPAGPDYEHPGSWWPRILCNPKYTQWIAKLIVFHLRQWEEERSKQSPPALREKNNHPADL